MSDVPVYVVANFTVHDADTYREYEKGFFPILKRHEGSFFTYDDYTVTFEGNDPREGRMHVACMWHGPARGSGDHDLSTPRTIACPSHAHRMTIA